MAQLRQSDLSPELLARLRVNYEALVGACDEQMGRLLDQFDRHDLWDDTWLILTTDHGLLRPADDRALWFTGM